MHFHHSSIHPLDFTHPTSGSGCEISKIVHQTWKTGKVHSRFRKHIRSWVARNPGWEYKFWTNEDNRNLIATKYPAYLDMYDNYPKNIQRADAIRCVD